MTRRLVAVLAAWTVLFSLTACTSHSARSPAPATLNAFRRLMLQPTDLGRAEARATQRCLRNEGFDAPLPIAAAGSVANQPIRLDESMARLHGYGDTIRRGSEVSPLDGYSAGLPAGRRSEFDRVVDDRAGPQAQITTPTGWRVRAPERGCVAYGRTAVYGSVTNWLLAYYIPQDLNGIAADTYLKPEVATALDRYRTCMQNAGHSVKLPQEAAELAESWAVDGPAGLNEVSNEEISLAIADASCQHETQIVDAWQAEFERLATPWISQNEKLVLKVAEIVRASADRAEGVLGQPD